MSKHQEPIHSFFSKRARVVTGSSDANNDVQVAIVDPKSVPNDISKTVREGPTQVKLLKYPVDSNERRFRKGWFKDLVWLEYSQTRDFCYACRHFGMGQYSSSYDIKKKYHEMSLIYHPDMKTGDSEKFMTISKAYKTLTNPEMLKTFYETGDPNGKKSIDFSIALPTWLSDEKYSTVILLIYGICFLVLLPTVVGIWWHRSMKYTNTKVIFFIMLCSNQAI
ncbi:Translocation protein SEC63-like [Oopsacas minuta]|uniref:Translocation protein SEC63-like n=1 Tax=Oopsacas minuta TaxID=111878 RepID=A0AAV7JML3_9METZ|nr:Translocation protein SEC63-like [Oopsacas minuta]